MSYSTFPKIQLFNTSICPGNRSAPSSSQIKNTVYGAVVPHFHNPTNRVFLCVSLYKISQNIYLLNGEDINAGWRKMNMQPKPVIEPGTLRSSVWRSPNWAISAYLWLIFTLKLRSLQKTQTLRKSANWISEPIHKRLYLIWRQIFRPRGISSNGRARASHARGSGIDARSSTYSCENIFTFTDKTIAAWIAWA